MSSESKKNLGIVSVVLGIAAWVGQKFDLIPQKVAQWMKLASMVTGAIAKFA